MALSRVKVWGAERLYASDLNAEFQNIIDNATSLISPLSGSLDWDGFSQVLDAAGTTSVISTSATGWFFNTGTKSGTPGTTGHVCEWTAGTFTDTATAGSGTATKYTANRFNRPTLAASNASVTTTDAATVYIVDSPSTGSNETITNAWSLWVDDGHTRLDGDLHVQGDLVAMENRYSLTASVAGNALTIALKNRDGSDASASAPIPFRFKNSTETTGTETLALVSGAVSTTISSGSTLATTNGTAHRIHIGALYTGSAVELCYWNPVTSTGIISFDDGRLITTTAEGGAGAADSAGVMYSTTSRSSVPWVYLGYIEGSQATAGTWASAVTRVKSEVTRRTGQVVQTLVSTNTAMTTGATALPNDNTIPQSGEGDQYLSLAITPTNAANRLFIEVVVNGTNNVENSWGAALFQDATANALVAGKILSSTANMDQLRLAWEMAAGTTSATTFKVRAGAASNTFTFNGQASGAWYGGVVLSYIRITETFV